MENLDILNEIDANNFKVYDDEGKNVSLKSKYLFRLMYMKPKYKILYSLVKNKFLSYGVKNRITNKCEYFRYKGIVGRLEVRCNSLKLFLPLDKKYLEQKRYFLKDFSKKEKYAQTPLMIRLRGSLSIKRALELIDIVMQDKNKRLKKNYVEYNYVKSLLPSGEAVIAKLGYKNEYIRKSINIPNATKDFPNNLIDYIPKIHKEELDEEIVSSVTLDSLCVYYREDEIVSLETLKEKQIITRGNYLRIKARGNLSKRLIIIADDFDQQSLVMLMQTNSVAVLIDRNE